MNQGQQAPQASQPSQLSQPSQPSVNMSSASASNGIDRHTRFLSTMIGTDKAFRIEVTIIMPDGTTIVLEKRYTQADQGSDMNVMSSGLVRLLGLTLHSLDEVGFKGLSMRTADHRETILYHFVWLRLSVASIVRDIRCFVAPELPHTTFFGQTEYLSLILGLPWLYSVDALISIRQSKIMVGDLLCGEKVREVIGPELVFCQDHNLLMYPKSAMATGKIAEELDDNESDSSESDSEDDLSDVEDLPLHPKQSFQ